MIIFFCLIMQKPDNSMRPSLPNIALTVACYGFSNIENNRGSMMPNSLLTWNC